MARGRRHSPLGTLGLILALIIIGASVYFQMNAGGLDRIYQAEAAITPKPTTAPPMIYAAPTERLLRSGSIGPEVLELQEKLKALGFYDSDLDGQYGNGTSEAVMRFQTQHGLEADGMAGEQTLNMIFSEAAQKIQVTPAPQLPRDAGAAPLLVSRTSPLPADYAAPDLVSLKNLVPEGLLLLKNPEVQGNREAVQALIRMIQAARKDGLETWQVSEGYRSRERQQELLNQEIQRQMTEEQKSQESARKAAERSVAPPGTSEHHTGLAFDLTVPGYYFGNTKQAVWLKDHCFEYGFILRYTASKAHITGFDAEPWHVRYVGEAHSRLIAQYNLALEEYLALYQQ